MARYDAVLFDLLTALLDSGSLWNDVANSENHGRHWRLAYLRLTYQTGGYRRYEDLVARAAETVGLDRCLGDRLAARYHELRPWPDVVATLTALVEAGVPLGIVTNCSRRLGHLAAGQVGVSFACIVTAEEAGFYKPDPRPYQLALDRLGVAADRCLFVAGSAHDLIGTARVGLPTYWHDRIGMTLPEGSPPPLAHERTLLALPHHCGLT